ncbi:LptA/OstA family protein [Nodosilinea sp. P-1105]|uniref:LptA/OstA family protein n=1 Tax=Nodosilinea sp. P-1105 TaxID=2546229 RepID=UPI001F11617A|nr:LptA/OstA family protein [Nodosilinea sp. P-1105]
MARFLRWSWLGMSITAVLVLAGGESGVSPLVPPQAQAQDTITLRSDVQEANTITGVITARGNVQIDYPAEQIRATSAQAEYYSNEQRIVLSGNVLIDQRGSTVRAEVVTYLIEEGQFVAVPSPNNQVESVYVLPESQAAPNGNGAASSPPAQPSSSRPPVLLDVSPIEPADPS